MALEYQDLRGTPTERTDVDYLAHLSDDDTYDEAEHYIKRLLDVAKMRRVPVTIHFEIHTD